MAFVMLFLLTLGLKTTQAQTATYTFTFNNAPINSVITEIAKKSNYQFIFDAEYLKKAKPVTAKISTSSLKTVLETIFKDQPFDYEINNNTIVLKQKAAIANDNTFTIKGKVIDSLGGPIPGTVIRVKGQSTGVISSQDGSFSIQGQGNSTTLVFTFIGYKEREYTASSSIAGSLISIVMASEPSLLKEVFVNGYQTISKEREAAAYAIVDNKKLNEQINIDLLSALEGRVAGLLNIKNPTGSAPDKPLLRGIGTFSNAVGTSPLIVIDGLPTEYTLDEVNPYDIESVTVLKDAAAASIYGSRSANGVIVLTTKQGKGSAVKINVNADLFITGKPDLGKMHYASTSDMIDYETAVYNAERARFATTESMFESYSDNKYYSPLYQLYRNQSNGSVTNQQVNNTLNQWRQNDYIRDYTENVWQNEVRQRYNVSFSSATDKNNTFLSLNYDRGKERIINNVNESFNLNFKSTYHFKSWLSATFGFNGTYANDYVTENTYDSFTIQPRYAQIVDASGNHVISDYVNLDDNFSSGGSINGLTLTKIKANPEFKSFGFNILDELNQGITNQKYLKLRTFANIQAKIYKGLSFNTQFQYEDSKLNREQYYDASSYQMRYAYNMLTSYNSSTAKYTHNLPDGGRYYQYEKGTNNYTFRNQLNYNQGFGKDKQKHFIAAIAGMEIRQTFAPRTIEQLRYGYDPITLTSVNLDNNTISTAGITSYFGGTKTLGILGRTQQETKHRFASFYSNMSYTFNQKYNLTGSVRVDQADFFGADPKYRNRPLWSVGAGWNASSESFLSRYEWLNLLKVRATYGINGNVDQTSSPYLVARRRNDTLYPTLQYTDIVTLPNPKLRWEKTATTNFGVDIAVFNNRLRGSIDVYNKYSSDLLVTTDLDPTVGATSRTLNNGALKNRGIEVSVGGDWFKTDDWKLSSNIIFAYNKNTVAEVNSGASTAYSYIGSPSNYFKLNDPYNSLYAYRYGGMTNGYPYFLDQNGQANVTFDANGNPTSVKDITSPDAMVRVGQLNPLYNGSFSQRIAYKNFELGALFIFSGGNKLRKDVTSLSSYDITDEDLTRRWNSSGTSELPRLYVDYPLALQNSAGTLSSLWQYSDVQVLDASYIKMRNISLSYSLPQKISQRLRIASAKLTVQANNLWYWSAAGDDIDPEAYSLNSGTRAYEIPKSFLMGLNVTF
ncbi:SusC/RagA family TonB-linked outer membrane protein [Pedobacter sp. KBW01]|uniref:SusC/RagA family TonB-linked outer membrane protein n=1 Tax=Pedobacter sp. KBW01 TaxID=2153364 RepID=UPI000F5B6139|nr:SusC/RagA family TonB-linked outer membrane protein [Pedobacter sp. KBW01]RQO68421.1 SusC/RagA family TonB-linked outer membrane protein [Pedobacter sp. KBW01]